VFRGKDFASTGEPQARTRSEDYEKQKRENFEVCFQSGWLISRSLHEPVLGACSTIVAIDSISDFYQPGQFDIGGRASDHYLNPAFFTL